MILDTAREWCRSLGGGREKVSTGGVRYRTRVALPAVVDVPEDVLRALREFNDALDAYVLPDGRVWLLIYEPDKPRIREGQKQLLQAKMLGDTEDLESALLMADGWSLLGELPYHEGTSAGAMLRHAQMTLYATRKQIEADQLRRKLIADGTAHREKATALLLDRVRSGAQADWAKVYRGRQQFSYSRSA